MAAGNTLTPVDCYAILNSVAKMVTGRTDIAVVDTSSFVSVGSTLQSYNAENTLSALTVVLSKTIFSVKPYKARLQQLRTNDARWGAIVRKIVYFPGDLEASQDWNTNVNGSQLADGQSVDMFTIAKPGVMQLNFYGTKVIQRHITRFRDQLALAFSSEAEFAQFIDGVMTEFFNDLETVHESETRLTLANYICASKLMSDTDGIAMSNVINVLALFNAKYHTGAEMKWAEVQADPEEFKLFTAFYITLIKKVSDQLQDRSAKYHFNPTVGSGASAAVKHILRFTPKANQRMIQYGPLFQDIQSSVLANTFNPEYLQIGECEMVNYWQSEQTPMKVYTKPNYLNAAGESVADTTGVAVDNVLGMLYDTEALGVNFQFNYSSVTPFNSAGGYYNIYIHERKNFWNDFTENGVIFIVEDPSEE